MSYRRCPFCNSNNKVTDYECYNCERSLEAEAVGQTLDVSRETTSLAQSFSSWLTAAVPIAIVTLFGGGLGWLWQEFGVGLPFLLEQLLLGTICAAACAGLVACLQSMPTWQLWPRLGPAAAFGAIVGFCTFSFWWTFELPIGGLGMGLVAGFFSAFPVVISFGLFGGESRPIREEEFLHQAVGLAIGIGIGLIAMMTDGGDQHTVPGVMAIFGLLSACFGGRINTIELLRHLDEEARRHR